MSHSQGRAVLVCAILLSVVMGCGERTVQVAASPSPVSNMSGDWAALAESPLSPRTEAHAFWTVERVLVIGASDGQPCPPNADCAMPAGPPLTDGAAIEPSTGEWAEIAPAPLPLGHLSRAVLSDAL